VDQSLTPSRHAPPPEPPLALPPTILGFIRSTTLGHQVALAGLSTVVLLLSAVPLELQRRLINDAIAQGASWAIVWLAAAYAGTALAEGGIKLVLNIYRGWVSENAVRRLRKTVHAAWMACAPGHAAANGVEASLILSEVEPVGGFIGVSVSEPLLQGGILVAVFSYMVHLQPSIALVSLLVFSPQLVFVPMMQAAINARVERRILVLRDVTGDIVGGPGSGSRRAAQDARIDAVLLLNMGIYKLKFSMNFLMNLMHHLGVAAVLGVGGWYAVHGEVEVGTVVAFTSGLAKVNDPWGDLVNWFRDATTNRVKYRLVTDAVAAFLTKAAPDERDVSR